MNKTETIIANKKRIKLGLREIIQNKDLLFILASKEISTVYKQTILGPIWYLISPLFTIFIYNFIFSNVAKIPTSELPGPIFYLLGIISWNFFAECLNRSATFLKDNAPIFGKVYFPRLIVPMANYISSSIKVLIQLVLLIFLIIYYGIDLNLKHLAIILYIFPMGLLGVSLGVVVSSLTNKYRDLIYLLSFGIQLLMYASPVIYPLKFIPSSYQSFILFNPLTGFLQGIRALFSPSTLVTQKMLIYSFSFTALAIVFSIIIFNSIEKNFVDSI